MSDNLISCQLKLSGFKDHQVIGLNLRERFSDSFRANIIVAVSDSAVAALKTLVSKDCSFTIHGIKGEKKTVFGMVTEIFFRDTAGDRSLVELVVEPKLAYANFGRQRKIYQDKSTVEIVEAVLGQSGVTVDKSKLKGSSARREYCVQYDESDLNFIKRLLASEGIGYFFSHSGSKSTLTFCDSKSAYIGKNNSVSGSTLSLGHFGGSGRSNETSFSALELEHALTLATVSVRSYDPEKANFLTDKKKEQGVGVGEWYRFDSRPLDSKTAASLAKKLVEGASAATETVRLATDSISLSPGTRFKTSGHPRSIDLGEVVVLDSQCVIENDSIRHEVLAQPIDAPVQLPDCEIFPQAAGLDMAVVVGPKKEEVWTDKNGRILVQFKWDRFGKNDETSSCWLRVSQIWAGKGFGSQFIPRVGQEVLVDFLGGDVDCPVVVGCLYNSEQNNAFSLPANQDKSGIRTQSFDGKPGDANWLIFSDKSKNELVNLHSNKDLLVQSLDQSVYVSGTSHRLAVNLTDQYQKLSAIENNVSEVFVNGSKKETISNSMEVTVGGSFPWASGEKKGAYNLKIDGDYKTEVGGDMTTDVKGDFKISVEGDLVIQVKGALELSADSDLTIETKKKLNQTGSTVAIFAKTGALTVKANSGEISLQGGTSASLKGGTSATLHGGTSATVKGGGTVAVQGASTSVKGSGSLALKGATVAISQG